MSEEPRPLKPIFQGPLDFSECCGASVSVQGRTAQYYVCQECGKPCDTMLIEREGDK